MQLPEHRQPRGTEQI